MRRRMFLPSLVQGGWLRRGAALVGEVRSTPRFDDAFLLPDLPLMACCCALVSKSRGLLCPTELERVLSSLEGAATVEEVQVIGISELGKVDIAKRTADLVSHVIDNCRDLPNLHCEMLDICSNHGCVTFFGAAGNDLLIAVAGPHDILAVAGFRKVHTLVLASGSLWKGMKAYQTFEVYSVENGVDKLKNADYSALSEFIVGALAAFEKEAVPPITANNTLKQSPSIPRRDRTFVVDHWSRYVAASAGDWNLLRTAMEPRHDGHESWLDFADMELPQTWATDANVAVLIDGESGSGKTLEMVCGHRDKSNLIIYMRFPPAALDASFYAQQCDIITDNDNIVQSIEAKSAGTSPEDLEELDKARVQRSDAFTRLAVAAVEVAVNDSRAVMSDVLVKLTSWCKKFTVRLCFDDINESPAFVRAFCAMDTAKLREELRWDPSVKMFVVAAGAGIGSVLNAGRSENKCSQLAMLTGGEASNGASVYWKMREHKVEAGLRPGCRMPNVHSCFNELLCDITALGDNWHDHRLRGELLWRRSKTLSGFFKAHAANEHLRVAHDRDQALYKELEQNGISFYYDSASKPLIQESLFAAVESDAACAVALSNPRMAALLVKEVDKIAQQVLDDKVTAAASGTSIGRIILQRAARHFSARNALMKRETASDVSALLVEALRYVLFDGYASPTHSAHMLVTSRGILIDNATYERDVPKEYAVVLGDDGTPRTMTIKSRASKSGVVYTACYPKDVGRYSISPAMMVVLSTLSLGAIENRFSKIGDGFEWNLAKFLYIAVQAFRGRPSRELVEFIVGSSSTVGEAAQKILDSSMMIDFRSLRMCEDRLLCSRGAEECSAAPKAPTTQYVTQDSSVSGAWIEISPTSLPSADVALHIPNVITVLFQCTAKLVGNASKHGEVIDTGDQELRKFCAPVISILYASRSCWNDDACSDDCDDKLQIIGERVIAMPETAARDVSATVGDSTIQDTTKSVTRLRRARASMMTMMHAKVGEREPNPHTMDFAVMVAETKPVASGVFRNRKINE